MKLSERLDQALKAGNIPEIERCVKELPRLGRMDTPEGAERFARVVLMNNGNTVKFFLKHGARADSRNAQALPMLCLAAEKGCEESVTALVNFFECDTMAVTPAGDTALELAFRRLEKNPVVPANTAIVNKLLNVTPLDTSRSVNGNAPLLFRGFAPHVIPNDDTNLLLLLERAQDMECRNPDDCTPLHLALLTRPWAIAQRALDLGADPYAKSNGRDFMNNGELASRGSAEYVAYNIDKLKAHLSRLDKQIHKHFEKAQAPAGDGSFERVLLTSEWGKDKPTQIALHLAGANKLQSYFEATWHLQHKGKDLSRILSVGQRLRACLPGFLKDRVSLASIHREYEIPHPGSVTVSYAQGCVPEHAR